MGNFVTGPAPRHRPKYCEVVRVKTPVTVTFTVLSESVVAVETHWYGNRSHHCIGADRECPGCTANWPYKWKGYIHAIQWGNPEPVFLELTEKAVFQLLRFMAGRPSLRGSIVKVGKSKGGSHGRYVIEVLERVLPVDELPASESPLPVLEFLWSSKRG